MGGLLSELGKKLAERWLSLLVLPGALYLAVAAAAHALGHTHPFALSRLTDQVTAWAHAPAARTLGGQVVLLAAILAASAAVGLAAQALGSLTERLYLAVDWRTWPSRLSRHVDEHVTGRQRDWDAAARAWHQYREDAALALASGGRQTDPAPRQDAYQAMARIAPERPARPTWSGDRIHAATVRLERDYHLGLATVWPHLWLFLPDAPRAEITSARQTLSRATTLFAWALLYLPLVAWWWPAVLITVTLALTGQVRTRAAADTYALLLEAVTRVHVGDLARHLGLDFTGPLTREAGDDLTRLLAHSPPPPPPPVGG
ncbi:hypothetical protein [Streptomyces sp. HUAS TT20]|uniref:hypothetical protein n=1 Tax=Streptomyces sp. HUAS TT20 TaxID=3447509 RepID=UPI0021D81DF9|nr:hypothetical protein [Streptomyces sp. HUAS 15-9]UXY25986.1 hypothetical protein N8I87_04950 [Streptomyces sp. HUAS 15-9]